MNDIPMVDAHVHFWDPSHLQYPWLEALPALNHPCLPRDYDKDSAAAQISKMIFVECGCSSDQSLAEVAWVSDLALTEPRLCGIVARAVLERGGRVRAELNALAKFSLVKGVRRNFEDEVMDFCLQPAFINGVRELAQFNFSLDICVRHKQLPSVNELVRECPEVKFVLDHCGKPDICHRILDPWRQHIALLAKAPNVYCKISGLMTEARRKQWAPEHFRPYVHHVLECFGPEKVMLGGDWPINTLGGSYSEWCNIVDYCLDGLDDIAKTRVYKSTAESFYRLDDCH